MKIIKNILSLIVLQIVMMIPILNVYLYSDLLKRYGNELYQADRNEKLLEILKSKLYIIYTEDDAEVSFINLDVLSKHADRKDFEVVQKWLEE